MRGSRELVERARALVFDLDGTLVDTVQDLWLALNAALREHGHAQATRDVVLASLHGGVAETARAALRAQGLAARHAAALTESYLTHYRLRRHASSSLYAGALDFLLDCRRRGRPMAVCTNKSTAEAMELLSTLGVDSHFVAVIGAEDGAPMKPDPAPLYRALHRLGVAPGEAVFLGDSVVDRRCADGAGVPFVLHAGGYGRDEAMSPPVAGFCCYASLAAEAGDCGCR